MQHINHLISTILICCFSTAFAQEEQIVALEQKLERSTSDTARINYLCQMAVASATFSLDESRKYTEKAFDLSQRCSYPFYIARALVEKSSLATHDGNYKEGLLYSRAAIRVLNADTVNVQNNEPGVSRLLGRIYNKMGTAYDYASEYSNAIKYYLKAKNIFESIGNLDGLGVSYNNLGISYLYTSELDKAESCFKEAYKLYFALGDTVKASSAKMNTGIIYHFREDFETAIDYYHQSYELMKSIGSLRNMGHSITNIGEAYADMGQFDSALVYSSKGIAIDHQLDDKEGLGTDYRIRGAIFRKMGALDSAQHYFQKGLEIARNINRRHDIAASLDNLAAIEKERGNFENAYNYLTELYLQRDTLVKESNSSEIGKLEAEADFNQQILKEKERSKLKLQQEEAKRNRQSIITYFTVAVLLVILFFVYMLIKSLRMTKEQKELVQHAKAEIEEKNHELTDSIRYAKRIQLALLQSDQESQGLPNHFIYFEPKDIVSGDFFWTHRHENYWYVAAADCTGHGVPGAMLTMLGTAFLNEICSNEDGLPPNQILDLLKLKITKELSQTGEQGESKDGMDMSLIRIDLSTQKAEWAGANNPLYLIRNGELIETKGNKQPVGYSENVVPFDQHQINLQKGDWVYLFSDGFPDQFGGSKGKKFKYSNFKKLLVREHKKSAQEQHDVLKKELHAWKGDLEQLDDICVIGIQF